MSEVRADRKQKRGERLITWPELSTQRRATNSNWPITNGSWRVTDSHCWPSHSGREFPAGNVWLTNKS